MSNRRYRNIYLDGCSHFCTASIVEYLPLLNNDRSRQVILDSWNRQRLRWNVLIEGFVIMPEHIHILVRGSADSVRKFMQYSLADASREISGLINIQSKTGQTEAEKWLAVIEERANGNALHKVWKERFRCIPLDKEQAVLVKLNYIHANPVKRGLVSEPAEWIYSSYSHYNGTGCILSIDSALSCGN